MGRFSTCKEDAAGRTLSRQFVEALFARTLRGSPDGYYELLMYKTSFQRKARATEGVTLTKESGHWQVSGYRIIDRAADRIAPESF